MLWYVCYSAILEPVEVRGGVQERAGPGRLAPPVPATHHVHPHGHHGQPHAHALPLTPRPTHGQYLFIP